MTESSELSSSSSRRRTLISAGAVGIGAALLLAVPGPVGADPDTDGLGSAGNSSSSLNLPELLGQLLAPDTPETPSNGQTACTRVIQIGDSTSVAADDAGVVSGADATATAQYQRVGVTDVEVDALNSRAIVGGPTPDAEQAVRQHLAAGKRGCWVIAMGVNDVGAIKGGGLGADERIDRIMKQLDGQSVLWPTVASSNPENEAFGAEAMKTFNDALRSAASRYPNLAVYDWAGAAKPEMFTDGIHYTGDGAAKRNAEFASALVRAFPAGGGVNARENWIRS
ncbi:MAG: SGNH/GDSL hydrolase family protein [Gordonia sp. (in: high G+C Gram-positive bacteria)]|uniref:SGNH/GDSL hydrolase family protein n=1 Tax=Gordonia sp. (in: high G+C Gram-positive bacteria) TaxID=84139 RepID=UPI0039E50A01